tara:strand:- start:7463 stop:7864 length:402 start_codon:yes stop_codon:yes gene_type:complete
MHTITREERRRRVRVSNQHRDQIAYLLKTHADEKAHKVYQNMSMHSCHFTHIAMVIWVKAKRQVVPDKSLALAWEAILMDYAKSKYPSAEKAGDTLLEGLITHGARILNMSRQNLIEHMHPLDQIKLGRVDHG